MKFPLSKGESDFCYKTKNVCDRARPSTGPRDRRCTLLGRPRAPNTRCHQGGIRNSGRYTSTRVQMSLIFQPVSSASCNASRHCRSTTSFGVGLPLVAGERTLEWVLHDVPPLEVLAVVGDLKDQVFREGSRVVA